MPSSTPGLKRKGSWTSEEDTLLKRYIDRFGTEDCWRNVPGKAGLLRSGKSCRMRWINYLRPDVKLGCITVEEEDLIARLHKLIGNRWSLIAGRLPGRTDNEIKNFWKCYVRKMHGITAPDSHTSKRSKIDDQRSVGQRSQMLDVLASPAQLVGEAEMATISGIHEVGDQNIWNSSNSPNKLSNDEIPHCDSVPATAIPQLKLEALKGAAYPEICRQPTGRRSTSNYPPWMQHPTLDFLTSSESSSFTTEPTSSSSITIRDTSCTSRVHESRFENPPSDCHIVPASSPEALPFARCDTEEELQIKSLHPSSSSATRSGQEGVSCASVTSGDISVGDEPWRPVHSEPISHPEWVETACEAAADSVHHRHLYSPNDVLGDSEKSGCGGHWHLYCNTVTWEEQPEPEPEPEQEQEEDLVSFRNLYCGLT